MARTFTHHQVLRNPGTECSSPKPLLGPCFENPVKVTSCDSSQVRHPIGVASCSRTAREYLLNSGHNSILQHLLITVLALSCRLFGLTGGKLVTCSHLGALHGEVEIRICLEVFSCNTCGINCYFTVLHCKCQAAFTWPFYFFSPPNDAILVFAVSS